MPPRTQPPRIGLHLLLVALVSALLWRIEVEAHGWEGLIWIEYFHWAIPVGVLLFLGWVAMHGPFIGLRRLSFPAVCLGVGAGWFALFEWACGWVYGIGLDHGLRIFASPHAEQALEMLILIHRAWTLLLPVVFIGTPVVFAALLALHGWNPGWRRVAVGMAVFALSVPASFVLLTITRHPNDELFLHAIKSGFIIPFLVVGLGLMVLPPGYFGCNPGRTAYDTDSVRRLFDEMAGTYGWVNVITSFGFAVRWRHQCLDAVSWTPGDQVVDLMCGMGELFPGLRRRLRGNAAITGVDFSPVMVAQARKQAAKAGVAARVLEGDALRADLPDGCADAVVCSFGLKTLDATGQARLAAEVARLLRPGGRFAFVEISVPASAPLRAPYLWYLHRAIPFFGRLLLGNPDNYRMLGRYTESFGDCALFRRELESNGLAVRPLQFFYGCATGVAGERPARGG